MSPAPFFASEASPRLADAKASWLETETGKVRYVVFSVRDQDQARGTAVIAHGLSEHVEKYHATISQLLSRNFSVIAADWRGHGLSSLTPDNEKDELKVCDADFVKLMEEKVLQEMPKPLIGIGHSYGGCLMCCAARNHPDWFAGCILCAPMLGIAAIKRLPFLEFAGKLLAPWWPKSRNAKKLKFMRHTSDLQRFNDNCSIIRNHPELAPKFHLIKWFNSSAKRIREMNKPGWYEQISTPMLLLVAGKEKLVINEAIRLASLRMQDAKIQEFEDAWHEILMERQEIQNGLWQKLDEFFDRIAPGQQVAE